MKDNFYLPDCGDNDVFSFGDTQSVMFRVSKLRDAMTKAFQEDETVKEALTQFLISQGMGIKMGRGWTNPISFGEGTNCEVLKVGAKSWQKGKIRIRVSLEFYPDEPDFEEIPVNSQLEISKSESPLDEIRRMINEDI